MKKAPTNLGMDASDGLSEITRKMCEALADACDDRLNMMVAVTALMNHRVEMLYRTSFIEYVDKFGVKNDATP